MYNEVDRLILDSFVECPHCQSKKVKCASFMTTITGYSRYEDEDHHNHEHDTNRIDACYKCSNGHVFMIAPLNSCWCGWRQGFPKNCGCGSKYEDPMKSKNPYFLEHIKNLVV